MELEYRTKEERLAIRREQVANGKRWCYDCINYYSSYFCGYSQSLCRIHGSLDCDQTQYHPDRTADICKDYRPNGLAPWYERI